MPASDRQHAIPDPFPESLFHYTDETGYEGILTTGQITPSLKSGPRKDADFGDGQYFTDIPPGKLTHALLAQRIYGNPLLSHRIPYFFEINIGGLNLYEVRENIFLVPNQVALDVIKRRISSGKNN
ncbi:HYD1 signature containing ADP-ribosyltransferase family protein [Streptomyces sp. NBC_00035]|uniref:HYD1 signature containing ADP-ribosyltransferase family protein n=1 Tax=Streptomyces sp. NBC_00035 TaxID=2903614 RepID=UPI003254234B